MSIFKTETRTSLQAGSHTLSNNSELNIHTVNSDCLELSFCLDGGVTTPWVMVAEDIEELIDVLTKIKTVMEG